MSVSAGDWCYSLDHDEPGRVIVVDAVWGEQTAQVWLARRDAVVRLHLGRLQPLAEAVAPTLDHLSYVGAAGRILEALECDALVAPLEGSVIPLPHQLYALQRAMSGDRMRYLLADEVGLGKTIAAHPVPTLLMGAALVWLAFERRPGSESSSQEPPTSP